jgi:hypothetical protein
VWTVFDGSAGALQALGTAAEIAAGERRPLFVAMPGVPRALAVELQRDIAARRERIPTALRVVEIDPFDAVTLLRHIRQSTCRMLVVERTKNEWVEATAESAEWPLVLV